MSNKVIVVYLSKNLCVSLSTIIPLHIHRLVQLSGAEEMFEDFLRLPRRVADGLFFFLSIVLKFLCERTVRVLTKKNQVKLIIRLAVDNQFFIFFFYLDKIKGL